MTTYCATWGGDPDENAGIAVITEEGEVLHLSGRGAPAVRTALKNPSVAFLSRAGTDYEEVIEPGNPGHVRAVLAQMPAVVITETDE